MEEIDLAKRDHTLFGRDETTVDVILQHPSISRQHAVVQYGKHGDGRDGQTQGMFVYDLGSTHGTHVNRKMLQPKMFHRLQIGDMVCFGESSRQYILSGDLNADDGIVDGAPCAVVESDDMKDIRARVEERKKIAKEREERYKAKRAKLEERQRRKAAFSKHQETKEGVHGDDGKFIGKKIVATVGS